MPSKAEPKATNKRPSRVVKGKPAATKGKRSAGKVGQSAATKGEGPGATAKADAHAFKTEGQPGNEITATVELRETDGATHSTLTNLRGTKEQRDAMVNYGAAAGAKSAWDRLAGVLRNDG